jgi:hypothetical protein
MVHVQTNTLKLHKSMNRIIYQNIKFANIPKSKCPYTNSTRWVCRESELWGAPCSGHSRNDQHQEQQFYWCQQTPAKKQ